MRTSILLLTVTLISLTSLASCSKEEPIRIGFIGGLSGRVADLGISGRNGVTLAIEKRNSTGGINGRLVLLIAMDDKQNKDAATLAFTSLVDHGVEAIIGHMTSSMSVSTAPLANRHRMVLMSPTSTTTYLKDHDDYFLRVCATTDTYGAEMARYFHNIKGLRRVTLIYDLGNRAYTESWINHFSEEFTRLGGKVIREVTFTSGPETHFGAVVQQALEIETDGLIISSSAVDAAMICQQVRKTNTSLPIGTSEWAATEKLIEFGGQSVEGVIVSQFFDRYNTEPRYEQFRDEFKNRFGQEPGFASVGGYDAANIIMDALALKDKNEDLKEAVLKTGTFTGIQGNITINRHGDSDRQTYRSVIRNGKFITTDKNRFP